MAKKTTTRKGHPRTRRAGGEQDTTTAVHATTADGLDIVLIDRLRVALLRDGDFWVAQGLEIDLAAQGNSLEEAQRQFERGLVLTLRENLRIYGKIDHVLRVAPSDVWEDLLSAKVLRARYSCVEAIKIRKSQQLPDIGELPSLPLPEYIDYYAPEDARA